jgi:predicted esterase YcpF (UPF0227 family)
VKVDRQRVIYLHGFNSSPASQKAQQFSEYFRAHAGCEVLVPELSHDPAVALQTIEACIDARGDDVALLVGSSLGGYYATYCVERHGMKAALINPAVAPCDHLPAEIIGKHRNLYTHAEYEFTREHVAFLRTLDTKKIRDPYRYLLLVQTGDTTLNYRLAVQLYAGCQQVVQEGGSHSFENFGAVLPRILQFSGLAQHSQHLSDHARVH